MTPASAIAGLDRQISAHGEAIVLARGATTQAARAIVRRASVVPIVPGVDAAQVGTMIVLSPTGLSAITAPARGDIATVHGREAYVEEVETVWILDVPVRFNLRVLG